MKTKQLVPVEIMVAKQGGTWTTITVKVEKGRGLEKRAVESAKLVLAGDETVANLTVNHVGEPEEPEMEKVPILLPPGTYRLDADVENPRPDRRSKDFFHQDKFPAGTMLVVSPNGNFMQVVSKDKPTNNAPGLVSGDVPEWNALARGMTLCDPTLESVITSARCSKYEIIKKMFETGLIGLADVQSAEKEVNADDDAKRLADAKAKAASAGAEATK